MILLALAAASSGAAGVGAVQPPLPHIWAEFGREGALSRVAEIVEIATDSRLGMKPFPYTLRFTRKSGGDIMETRWTDARKCPVVQKVIHGMRDVPMPFPAPYGSPDVSLRVAMDGTGYYLKSPSSYSMGTITLTSNVNTPLSKWVDAAFRQLAACWTDDPNG